MKCLEKLYKIIALIRVSSVPTLFFRETILQFKRTFLSFFLSKNFLIFGALSIGVLINNLKDPAYCSGGSNSKEKCAKILFNALKDNKPQGVSQQCHWNSILVYCKNSKKCEIADKCVDNCKTEKIGVFTKDHPKTESIAHENNLSYIKLPKMITPAAQKAQQIYQTTPNKVVPHGYTQAFLGFTDTIDSNTQNESCGYIEVPNENVSKLLEHRAKIEEMSRLEQENILSGIFSSWRRKNKNE